MLVGASCTAELIQDDPGGLAARARPADPGRAARAAGLPEEGELGRGRDLLPAGPHARGPAAPAPGTTRAARAAPAPALQHPRPDRARLPPPRRRRRDHRAARRRSASTSTSSRRWAPRPADLARLGEADFNVVLYPEIAGVAGALAAAHLRPARRPRPCRSASAPRATSSPKSRRSPASMPRRCSPAAASRLPWYSRSVDSTYLTGKRVFIFGDATHAIAAARIARRRTRLHGRRPRHLQPRIRPRGPRRPPSATASRR